jgi:hypothetical protein
VEPPSSFKIGMLCLFLIAELLWAALLALAKGLGFGLLFELWPLLPGDYYVGIG